VLALLAASLLEVGFRVPDWRFAAIFPFTLLWTLPLLLRRRSGVAAGLTVTAAAAASSFVTGRTVASAMWLAMVFAFAVMGFYGDRKRAFAAASLGFVFLLIVSVNDQGPILGVMFGSAIFAFGPFAAGAAVRARALRADELVELARRLEAMRDEEARIAVAEERARIAAELNEVIARAVSVMIVQAVAARLSLPRDSARARNSIEAVEETGREALAETRRLLGVLRADQAQPEREPPPGLGGLARAGMPVAAPVLDGALPLGGPA
jgi:signal transduction histidine kinase